MVNIYQMWREKMKIFLMLVYVAFASAVFAESVHTYNINSNTVTTVCDLGATKLTFEYPNPAGSSNYTNANSVKLVSSEDIEGVTTDYNLKATQLFLTIYSDGNTYGNAVSALFVNDNAEVVLGLNSNNKTVWGQAVANIQANDDVLCLFDTGE